jgi:hypothetical protein
MVTFAINVGRCKCRMDAGHESRGMRLAGIGQVELGADMNSASVAACCMKKHCKARDGFKLTPLGASVGRLN